MRKSVIMFFCAALFGCGGGSGSNSGGANSITGKVIDGYISGATVFWDCDLNGKLDTREVSTTSSAGGVYTISPSPQSGCRLTALIPASAIDEDTGKSVFTPYAMTALDSNSTIISPLTTLAVLHPTSSQSVAADEIKTKLNLTLSLDTDYVAQTTSDSTNTRKFAKVAAQLLQANYSNTSGYSSATNATIVNGMATIQNTIASASLSAIIKRALVLPPDLWNKTTHIFYSDPTLKVKINSNNNLSNSQLAYLNSLIADSRITPYLGSGQISWNRIDPSTLKEINYKLGELGFTSPNLASLRDKHTNQTLILSEKYKPLLQDAVEGIVLDSKTILSLYDVAGATVKGAYGTAKMASIVPNFSGVFAYINMTPGVQGKMIKNIAKIKKHTDFVAATGKCGVGISDLEVFTQPAISPSDYAKGLGGVSKMVGCVGDMIDSNGVSYVAGLFQGGSESFDDQFDGIMTFFDTLNIAIGLTPPTPYSNFVSGFIDLASAGVESYKAGQTIAKQANDVTEVAQAEIYALWNTQQNMLDKNNYIARIQALTVNSIIREDWIFAPSPSIASISPATATAGEVTTFTVAGTNLPTSRQLDIAFNGCANIAVTLKSENLHKFTCTPQGAGTITADIRATAGETVLKSQQVTVTSVASANLLLGATVSDSCFNCTIAYNGDPNNITDGNMESGRNLGMQSGTFHIFLTNPKSIGRLKLLPAMTPNGLVYYEIQTSTDPTGAVGTWTSHGGEKSSEWANNTWFDFTLNTNTQNVRVIKVNVTYTPSWLAFFEIEAYAP